MSPYKIPSNKNLSLKSLRRLFPSITHKWMRV
uniref:Uncharacterized protein n=1 Tax=Rhizophora mucronata TaxID=61149 RepID=A0A2P2Q8K8_RHIMU